MAQSGSIKTQEFDSIVIGAGLSGLLAANVLEAKGRNVALLEGHDVLGGTSRPVQTPIGKIDNALKLFPESHENDETLAWLESVLDEKIERQIIEEPPVNFDDGKFKPFIGFGDQKVESAFEIDAYARARYLRLSSTPKDWVEKLSLSFTGTIFPQSFVTKMQVEDDFVTEIIVNGAKRFSAREVIFCATPQQLIRFLPETHVPVRLRQRLLKGEFWTSINLSLIHRGVVTENNAVHVLKGGSEEPCVGLFHPPVALENGESAQLSQWVTFVHRDITDDSETVGAALKQIKRQIKRAYETSLDGLLKERIAVNPTSHGDLHGVLQPDGRWPKIQNLWLISSFLDQERNLPGAIRQARRTVSAIDHVPVDFPQCEASQ